MRRALLGVALILSLLAATGCITAPASTRYTGDLPNLETPPGPHRRKLPPPEVPERARILAVGDLLMHLPLVTTSALPDNQWDFTPLFEPVRPWIEGADLALANLETTLTGPRFHWAGYPAFNTPPEFARDLKAVGFDAITHANNHTLDYGEYGLIQTIEALDKAGLPRTGANRTQEEQDRILVVDVTQKIKMAVLAFTYGTNGIPLPHPWSVNMLDPERMRRAIRRARHMPEVDLVAVALHMGDEYARQPNQTQEEYIQLSLRAGADIILGNHPHVIQPIHIRQMTDEFGRDGPRAIIYSLGNFISNQVGLHREAGLMFVVDVVKENGVARIEQAGFVPTWVHPHYKDGRRKYRVVAVEKAMRDYEAKADPSITEADYRRLQAVWADTAVQAVGSGGVVLLRADDPVLANK